MDGGNSHPFKREFLKKKKAEPKIDMVIVTHIDRDHIGGIIDIFKDNNHLNNIKYLLFNEPEKCNLFFYPSNTNNVSANDGNSLIKLLEKNKHIEYVKSTYHNNNEVEDKINSILTHMKIKVLSPSKQALDDLIAVWNPSKFKIKTDSSNTTIDSHSNDIVALAEKNYKLDDKIPNKSSLALLITHNNKHFLLLGDAHITQVNEALVNMGYSKENPLIAKFIKLSHHGSIKNINTDFLNLVRTENYIICPCKSLPNKETIAKIAVYGKTDSNEKLKHIFITKPFKQKLNFSKEDHSSFNFRISYQDEWEFSDAD